MFRIALASLTAAGLAVVGLVGAAPAVAATSQPVAEQRLDRIQHAGAAAIERRQTAISTAKSTLANHAAITDADRATLNATLDRTAAGLRGVGQELAGDTTASAALPDYESIFTDYRVYALVLPQVRLTTAADAMTGKVIPRLKQAQAKLQQALNAAPAKNTDAVKAAMSDLGTKIAAIETQLNGLSSQVLSYSVADYNANHAILAPARSHLRTAASDSAAAAKDIAAVTKALK